MEKCFVCTAEEYRILHIKIDSLLNFVSSEMTGYGKGEAFERISEIKDLLNGVE